ncbi:OmpA family protein [Roseivivax sp. CAU 1761]
MTPITLRRASAALAAACAALPAAALDLVPPTGARAVLQATEAAASYRLPTGPWQPEAGLPARRIDGEVARQVWQVPGRSLTTLQLLAPLRAQIAAVPGWSVTFDCETEGCGGFDFRFATEVVPAPEMQVTLSDYRFLAARGPDGAGLGLLVSRTAQGGYIQSILARPGADPGPPLPGADPAAPLPSADPAAPPAAAAADGAVEPAGDAAGLAAALPRPAPGSVVAALARDGHVVLADMRFESGAATLGAEAVPSLDAIAGYLAENPGQRLLFVGHTDATGSLEANRALSRRRAEAAMAYLRRRHGIAAARLEAEGAGYLAPVASHLSDAGHARNRRVEAVLLPPR